MGRRDCAVDRAGLARIPDDFHGTKFMDWFDIFVEYALLSARRGDGHACFATLDHITSASVFYQAPVYMRDVELVRLACGVVLDASEHVAAALRQLLRQHPFADDLFRLYSAAMRLCSLKVGYNSSAAQKNFLRYVKAMDLHLLAPHERRLYDPAEFGRTRYWRGANRPDAASAHAGSGQDVVDVAAKHASADQADVLDSVEADAGAPAWPAEHGPRMPASPERTAAASPAGDSAAGDVAYVAEHSPALLALYAHILLTGGAFRSALNYYFRALVLRPDDAAVHLSIAACYLQHALTRQSENRHYQLHQALAFIGSYRDLRVAAGEPEPDGDGVAAGAQGDAPPADPLRAPGTSGSAMLAQEAEYNEGRAWHALGLTHHAVPCYERALALRDRVRAEAALGDGDGGIRGGEDFAAEAAFALQSIYAFVGDWTAAVRVTEEHMVM